MKTKVKISIFSCIAVIIIFAILLVLFSSGVLKLNNPSKSKYPVRGVDVSSYQGDISWDVLASQDIILLRYIDAYQRFILGLRYKKDTRYRRERKGKIKKEPGTRMVSRLSLVRIRGLEPPPSCPD